MLILRTRFQHPQAHFCESVVMVVLHSLHCFPVDETENPKYVASQICHSQPPLFISLSSGHWRVNGVEFSVSYLRLLPNVSWSPSAFPQGLDKVCKKGLENGRHYLARKYVYV